MADRFIPIPALGAAAVAVDLCCGAPVLLSAGVLTALAGLGLGSWLVLAIGAAVVVAALVRIARRTHAAATARSTDTERSETRIRSHVN